MSAPTGGAPQHVPALDGLRGVAVGLVLLLHLFHWRSPEHAVDRVIGVLTGFGWVGVDLFFVLSGYLITGILLSTREAPNYYRSFFARRALRIFPLHYAYLALVFLLLSPLAAPASGFVQAGEDRWWWWTYVGNLLLSRTGDWDTGHRFVQHFWSLAVEEQFYLFWPFVVRLLPRRGLARLCVALLVLSPLARWLLWETTSHAAIAGFVGPIWRMDALAAGALLATVADPVSGLRPYRRRLLAAATVGAVAIVLVVRASHGSSHETPLMQVVGFSAVWMMFAALLAEATGPRSAVVPRLLSAAPLRFLGRYSYGLYVLHPLVGTVVAMSFFPRVLGMAPGELQWPVLLPYVAAATAATILAALVSWWLIEARALALKRHFPAWSSRTPALEIGDAARVPAP